MDKKNNDKFLKSGAKALMLLALTLAFAFSLAPIDPYDHNAVQTASALTGSQVTAEVQAVAGSGLKVGQKLIPLGRTTGIKMYAEGPVIVGLTPVGTESISPAQQAGMTEGDIILAVNGKKVDTNEALMTALTKLKVPDLVITTKRESKKQDFKVTAIFDESMGRYLIGAWVRDSMAGIGTITFVDPETGIFGALGHSVTDVDTGMLVPFYRGSVMESAITSVKKGESGAPGELIGSFNLRENQGSLSGNTIGGISGKLFSDDLYNGIAAVTAAAKSEIKIGPATILANIEDENVKQYDIEIVKIYKTPDGETRDMMIRITDPALIEKTGGIVQGMSGSPIIQDGKLIGAITHVLVNDPVTGYAISIENMIKYLATSGDMSKNV